MPDLRYRLDNGIKGRHVIGYSHVDGPKPSFSGTTDKKKTIKAAKDLGYSRTVIRQLEDAETDEEIARIMGTARKRSLE